MPASSSVDDIDGPLGVVITDYTLSCEPSDGANPSGLSSAVFGDQVGGDAVEPGSGVGAVEVVGGSFLERDSKRLAEEPVGLVGAEATDQVAVQDLCVTIDDRTDTRWSLL